MQQPSTTATPSRGAPTAPHPQRITQLQCLDTNSQLQQFFIQSISQSFKYMPRLLGRFYDEIQLLVGFAEFRFTVALGHPHPGDSLQNIQYKRIGKAKTKGKWVLLAYFFFSVLLPYIRNKVVGWLLADPVGWKDTLLKLINAVDRVLMVLNLINSSLFIRYGKYRTLSERAVGLPMQFITGESARVLNFGLMNRRMIWQIYQLFLKTVMPFASDIFGPTLKSIFYLNSYLQVSEDRTSLCIFCQSTPKLTMKSQCGHLACYYCSHENKSEQKCRLCEGTLGNWKSLF